MSLFGITHNGVPNHYKFEFKQVQQHDTPDIYLRSEIDEDLQHWGTFRNQTMKTMNRGQVNREMYNTQLKLHWQHSVPPKITTFAPTHPHGKKENISHRTMKGDFTFENSNHYFVPSIVDNKRSTAFAATLPRISGHTLEMTRAIPKVSGRPITSEHSSGLRMRDYLHKHRRLEHNPQDKFMRPMTSSDAIGWHHKERMAESKSIYLPKKSCDVTRYASTMIKNNH
jgi:hypothetical protein